MSELQIVGVFISWRRRQKEADRQEVKSEAGWVGGGGLQLYTLKKHTGEDLRPRFFRTVC